jgi:hypothetical protein
MFTWCALYIAHEHSYQHPHGTFNSSPDFSASRFMRNFFDLEAPIYQATL